ncbi:hypothetical protein [Parahaliea mediterranea]|uniref:hypothetical protein n=1 Tax=Parahaliea mediterranea TaxID=651086 RepID=UPI000E2FCD4E|nr:hypothetical protein [Parahaliea mediterranea]
MSMNPQRQSALIMAVLATCLSLAGYWGLPAFGALVTLSFIAVPLGAYCALNGAPKTAAVAVYFGVATWLPFLVSRDSTFFFGKGYFALLPGGLVLCLLLVILHLRSAGRAKRSG